MRKLVLMRLQKKEDRTLGWMICYDHDGLFPLAKMAVMELPWRDNQKMISCIPVGRYRVTPEQDERRGFVLRVHDVPNRDGILLHRGSKPSDSTGCILLGSEFSGDATLGCIGAQSKLQSLFPEEGVLVILDAA